MRILISFLKNPHADRDSNPRPKGMRRNRPSFRPLSYDIKHKINSFLLLLYCLVFTISVYTVPEGHTMARKAANLKRENIIRLSRPAGPHSRVTSKN